MSMRNVTIYSRAMLQVLTVLVMPRVHKDRTRCCSSIKRLHFTFSCIITDTCFFYFHTVYSGFHHTTNLPLYILLCLFRGKIKEESIIVLDHMGRFAHVDLIPQLLPWTLGY